MTLSTQTCDRCGDEYEGYIVLIRDNFSDIVEHLSDEYDNLCKPCRAHLHPDQPFPGGSDVEPKVTVTNIQ